SRPASGRSGTAAATAASRCTLPPPPAPPPPPPRRRRRRRRRPRRPRPARRRARSRRRTSSAGRSRRASSRRARSKPASSGRHSRAAASSSPGRNSRGRSNERGSRGRRRQARSSGRSSREGSSPAQSSAPSSEVLGARRSRGRRNRWGPIAEAAARARERSRSDRARARARSGPRDSASASQVAAGATRWVASTARRWAASAASSVSAARAPAVSSGAERVMDDARPGTRQKALALNLKPSAYGTIAEIGGGQEVARWFFHVGGAAGTIAKTISAYDMAVSDSLYGAAGRYVSRQRLTAMLEREYAELVNRLGPERGAQTAFFAFADTVATASYHRAGPGRGWLGIRFQASPGAPPSELLIHAHLLDPSAAQQQEALGVLGVNIVYAAYFYREDPPAFIASLLHDLSR